MSHLINQHPAESLRNAMIAYYLHHKVPEKNKNKINNADDLYEYWLLDVQVSQAVSTSPVACAISSLQQYITRIQLGLEPGYENKGMSTQQKQLWRELLHTYPTWSAGQQLRYHPANYLDPTLRSNKSASFQQLENDLSQYRIQTDAVMTAVQNYLARFEEIANIRTLNGYIDGNTDALHNSSYYFVGKSSSENTYYWRSLNLCKRLGKTLFPYAWSDWKKINLTLAEDTIESSIRPVFFNNRLFFYLGRMQQTRPYQCLQNHRGKSGKQTTPERMGRQPLPSVSPEFFIQKTGRQLERFPDVH
ncbi:neuraminidase-like domain-containing protein [Pseudomonas tritici]|uniref:neuraminidase-like domain-containing protein n=1 Tax=Pseudomonas tritici TaxID=2745518 RepID=UPI00387AFB22